MPSSNPRAKKAPTEVKPRFEEILEMISLLGARKRRVYLEIMTFMAV